MMLRSCSVLRAVRLYRGIRSAGLAQCWVLPLASGFRHWPSTCNAHRRPSVGPVDFISNKGLRAYWQDHSDRVGRSRFPPLQRAQIVQLACLEPIAKGLHITHWSSEDLALQAVAEAIVPTISARTVRRILNTVDLQPHRTRYWKTSRLDEQFKQRAEKVLWCYSNAPRLAERGIWTICVDESLNHQVLERHPLRRAIPGSIEQQEFEYTRHGTVNILMFLIVHSVQMEVVIEPRKDATHYIEVLHQFRQRHQTLNGVFLIQDGDPSHTAHDTQRYLTDDANRWWRSRYTPAHASWLNQAEILINSFSQHYLKRQSWTSRKAFIEHVLASAPEYNRCYAHPIEWTWTNHKMRQWFAKHAP